ncbi:MAG: DUF177 domain-containing protein [Clostridia bacterium]|nr:DUF177 domain-containing protein [Clostridia bacterium]
MIIDVSSILKEFGGKIDINDELVVTDDSFSFDGPVKIKGSIYNNGQSLTFKADCSGVLKTQCARCLKDIDVNVEFPVEENLVQNNEDAVSDDADVILFEGYTVDIDDIIINSFILNTSMKYLCDEDCKGLCQNCGADLNEGECGCNQEYVDPRWSGLVDILNSDKE